MANRSPNHKSDDGSYAGLEALKELTSLDLSFNRVKHIRNLDCLTKLRELYLVQNKISKIEGLEHLQSLTCLELGANRIRVCNLYSVKKRHIRDIPCSET